MQSKLKIDSFVNENIFRNANEWRLLWKWSYCFWR